MRRTRASRSPAASCRSRDGGRFQDRREAAALLVGPGEPLAEAPGREPRDRLDEILEAGFREQRPDLGVVRDRHDRSAAREGEDGGVKPHREDQVAAAEERGGVGGREKARKDSRAIGVREPAAHPGGQGEVVVLGPWTLLEGNEEERGARALDEGIERRRRGRFPRFGLGVPGPRPEGHADDRRPRLDTHADEDVLRSDVLGGGEEERGIGRDRGRGAGNAHLREQRARGLIADGDPGGAGGDRAHDAPRRLRGERAETEAVEAVGLARGGGERGGTRVERDAAVPGGQEGSGVDAGIVLEEAAASDHHEVAAANGLGDRQWIPPEHGIDAVPQPRLAGVSRDDDEARGRAARGEPRDERRQDRLVAGVAETVVPGDEDGALHRGQSLAG